MISNIKYLTEIIAYLFCMAELYGQRFRLSIHAVVLIILDLFLLTGINEYGFPIYLHSLLYVSIFLYGWLYYGESVKKTLINCVLTTVIMLVLQLLLCSPAYFWNEVIYENQEWFGLIVNIVAMLLIAILGERLRLEMVSSFFLKRDKIILVISILVLIALGVNQYQIWINGFIFGEQYIQLVYFLLLLGFTFGELQKTKLDAEKRKMQLEMNKLYYDAYDQLLLLVRERQHDTKNHIDAILSMIYTTDNYEELVEKQREYCDFVIEQNEETRLLLTTGNPLIAGFLYCKIQKAKHMNVHVSHQIDMKTVDIALPEYELVEMIGILFDNAVEALSKMSQKEKKMIISIKEKTDELEIMIANTSDFYDEDITEKFFEAGYSNKGYERGIGLPKLNRMVRNRDGKITVSNEMLRGENYLVFTISFSI